MHKTIEDLHWRYATKAFDPSKKVSEEDMASIIEAFRLTPSSFGLQPWKLIVVQDQKLKETLVEHTWGQQQVAHCSDLLVFARKNNFGNNNIEDYIADISTTRDISIEQLKGYEDMMKGYIGHLENTARQTWANNQVYIALGNVMTVCANMRIDTCPIEGFISEKYDEVLGLREEGLSSVVVLPIGYSNMADRYAELKKVRFNTESVVLKI